MSFFQWGAQNWKAHQCQVQGNKHCPGPDGHTIADTEQDAIGHLGTLGSCSASCQPALQHPYAFQPLFPSPVALSQIVVIKVKDSGGKIILHGSGVYQKCQGQMVAICFKSSAWTMKTGHLEPLLSVVDLNQDLTKLVILTFYTNNRHCLFHDLGEKTTDICLS